jgi:succinyl-diaminopimelate desuccinylase
MINKNRLIKLTQDLLRINSENPPGDEREIAAFVVSYLKKTGLKPRRIRFFPRRDNVLAVLKGRSSRSPVLITPHLDTVPAGKGWARGPFSGALAGGKIYGRGATDCKGNLAVALEVMRSLAEDGAIPENDVIFLATADEETGSQKGLAALLKRNVVHPAFAVILDSDEFYIITAQKGLMHFTVEVCGKKAHGAYPDRGINAIKLIGILKSMKFSYRPHPLLKPPTVNIGTIHGGDKVNMVADACAFEADLRYLPGMRAKSILAQVRAAFDKTGARYRIRIQDTQKPYEITPAHPLVIGLKKAAAGVVKNSRIKGSEGATVITFFQSKKIPAVATGYGAKGCAHATDEYVRAGDLYRGAIILERFLKSFPK